MKVLEALRRVAAPVSKKISPPDGGDIFDDEFQRKLEYLAIVSRRVFSGRLRAERRTKKSGSGVEFADHRDYVAGDDFRYLDWNVYSRMGRLLVRLYEEEEDLSIYLVVDCSSSMGFGGGKKLLYAKRLAAALAYIGLSNLDRIAVLGASDRLRARIPSSRGKARIFTVFSLLRSLQAGGTTDLADALRTFAVQYKRRGLVVLLTDLYDPHGFEGAINVLRYARFEPFVLHIVDANDAQPSVSGDVRVYDCETGDERDVTVTPKLLAQVQKAHQAYLVEIRRFCLERQVNYVAADVSVPFDELVLRVLRRGGLFA